MPRRSCRILGPSATHRVAGNRSREFRQEEHNPGNGRRKGRKRMDMQADNAPIAVPTVTLAMRGAGVCPPVHLRVVAGKGDLVTPGLQETVRSTPRVAHMHVARVVARVAMGDDPGGREGDREREHSSQQQGHTPRAGPQFPHSTILLPR